LRAGLFIDHHRVSLIFAVGRDREIILTAKFSQSTVFLFVSELPTCVSELHVPTCVSELHVPTWVSELHVPTCVSELPCCEKLSQEKTFANWWK